MKNQFEKNNEFNCQDLQITPEDIYLNRRKLIQLAGFGLGAISLNPQFKEEDLSRKITEEKLATSYNNFYEFSFEKDEVREKVTKWNLNIDDWKIEVEGLVEKKGKFSLEEIVKLAGGKQEERVYRFRCVEAWSMVLPWGGFELSKLIESLKPSPSAKFVAFQSFSKLDAAVNMTKVSYPWPYQEALTIEEAKNKLAFMATGLYGKLLPKQNGAPIRLVVPWKYGFKSIKSIQKIIFLENQPKTLWNELAPKEYGFYANVNPRVDHPRWSQARERVIDGKLLPNRQDTLLFNGYAKYVEHLYKGLDLTKNI